MSASTFAGGIHPKYNKDRSKGEAITKLDAPTEMIFPLSQHIGAPAKACVEKGDEVLVGQVIGEAGGFVSAPVHSSVSGKVKAIEMRPGTTGPVMSVVIENDGEDKMAEFEGLGDDWASKAKEDIVGKIRDAGIVGMGGAAFPTHVKLSPPPDKPIDTLILNGAECEPYLTADHRMMVEHSEKIMKGLEIGKHLLGAKQILIAIEENKPDAIEAMTKAAGDKAKVVPLKIKYPQGAEKQIIDACLKRQVPSGGLPMAVGVVVQNVGTAAAMVDAVVDGIPLYERVVTVTGSKVNKPANLLVRVGTPVSTLLEACEGDVETAGKLVSGGPMMGFALSSAEPSVTKGTSGILLLSEGDFPTRDPDPCIRCGRCLGACPMRLIPTDIALHSMMGDVELITNADGLDCVECGSCAHECPSGIQLVQQIRLGKALVNAARRKNG